MGTRRGTKKIPHLNRLMKKFPFKYFLEFPHWPGDSKRRVFYLSQQPVIGRCGVVLACTGRLRICQVKALKPGFSVPSHASKQAAARP